MKNDIKKSLYKYTIGFSVSLVLTFGSFGAVYYHEQTGHEGLSHDILVPLVVAFAVVQLIVQLVFFLHLGRETKPRWNYIVFLFMVLVLVIVVVGSLWIMDNLEYNMMHADEIKHYMEEHPGSF